MLSLDDEPGERQECFLVSALRQVGEILDGLLHVPAGCLVGAGEAPLFLDEISGPGEMGLP